MRQRSQQIVCSTRKLGRAAVAAVLAAALLGTAGCSARKPLPKRTEVQSEERQFSAPADGDTIAIFTTSMGEIRAVLYPDSAPMAVYNFVGLARSGYYNDTIIWRSEYGFAVQGGDATGTGTGGSTIWNNNPYPLEAATELRHYAGALCTALTQGDTNSGESQFYFVTALPNSVTEEQQTQLAQNGYSESQIAAYAAAGGLPYLDNTDTVFGQIYSGMEVADKMASVKTEHNEDGSDTFRPEADNTITIESVTIATYPGPTTEELAATPVPDSATASSGGAE